MIKKTFITGPGYYAGNDDISFVGLTRDEEQTLFIKWQKNEDYEARDVIIQRHLLFVASYAVKCAPSWLPEDEAISAGNVGLMEAVNRFDPTRGAQFSTYVRKFIHGKVIAACRSRNPVRVSSERTIEQGIPLENLDPKDVTPDFEMTEEHPVEADDHRANQIKKMRLALRRSWITPIERHVAIEHNFNGKDYQTIATEMPKELCARTLSRQWIGRIHKRVCAKLKTLMAQYGVDEL